jgi:hypothetical protein
MRNSKFLTQKSYFAALGLKYVQIPISTLYKIPKRFLYNKKDDIEEFGIKFYLFV